MFRKRSDINLKHQLSFLLLFCIYNTVLVFFFFIHLESCFNTEYLFLGTTVSSICFRPNNPGTDKLTIVLVLFNE